MNVTKNTGNGFAFFYHLINTAIILIVLGILQKHLFSGFKDTNISILLLFGGLSFCINYIQDLLGIKDNLEKLYEKEMKKGLFSRVKFAVCCFFLMILIVLVQSLD